MRLYGQSHIPPAKTTAYPMAVGDWYSLRDFIVSQVPLMVRVQDRERLAKSYRRSFLAFEREGWGLKYRSTDRHYFFSIEVKTALGLHFSDLPKYLGAGRLRAVIVQWRLQVGK